MIVGSYGSGKTEVAVNLSIQLAEAGREVQVADLDIVNPYFRCREARRLMERHGIRVVVPPGAQAFADLPIILPEIQGMLHPPDGILSLFDVGGDDVGARALAAFRPRIMDGEFELWQVINSRRPFTDTTEGCLAMQRSIEQSSRFAVTGLLVNSHLMEDTTPEVVLQGWDLARTVAQRNGLPIRCVAAMEHVAESPALAGIDVPLLRMQRHMLPPWLVEHDGAADPAAADVTLPAPRPVPLGKPGPIPIAGSGGNRNGQDRN